MNQQYDDIKRNMLQFTYFSSLTQAELNEGYSLAKIKCYNSNETIFGDGIGFPNFVYFIIVGKCRLIEAIKISMKISAKKTTYKLYKAKEEMSKMTTDNKYNCGKNNLQTIFMQVCIVDEGGCFNLGESMINRRLVAVDKVQCLLLPITWLWKNNTADIWSRVKRYVAKRIPPKERIFEEFVLNRRWREHETNLINDIVDKKLAVNCTTIHEIPYSIRIQNNLS